MRGDANTTMRTGTVGSGWIPSNWCHTCHAPYRAELPACPECPTEPLPPGPALIVRLLTLDLRAMRTDHAAAVMGIDLNAACGLMEGLEAARQITLGTDALGAGREAPVTFLRRYSPHIVFVTSWPTCFALVWHLEPTSPALLKLAFAVTVTVASAAAVCLMSRWAHQKEIL
ncbi:hypothetical protein [Deinococcus sp.]|uniref:hypothetical protein n=1 Tax=Deinococcus sp. TaxID=47478 RepID=UPI002869EB30|nr:hypothetical protein [Deinococcus sp.]